MVQEFQPIILNRRLRRIACRIAHEWLDQSDEVFEAIS